MKMVTFCYSSMLAQKMCSRKWEMFVRLLSPKSKILNNLHRIINYVKKNIHSLI